MAKRLKTAPPAWLETVVSRLVPPACREHVLGDFFERYRSPWQYVADALATLPFVVAGQIRRTANPLRLVMCAFSAFVCFNGISRGPTAADAPAWFPAFAVAAGVAAALVVRDAYRNIATPPWRRAVVDAVAALALAMALLTALSWFAPHYSLSEAFTRRATLITLVAVFLLRVAHVPAHTLTSATDGQDLLSLPGLSLDVHRFEQRIRRRNVREMVAAFVVVVAFGTFFLRASSFLEQAGCALAIAGALVVAAQIWSRCAVRPVATDADLSAVTQAYASELARHRDLLLTVTTWYMLPFAPAVATLTLARWEVAPPSAALLGLASVVFVVAVGRQVNRRAAARLQRKVDRLQAALAAHR